MLSVMGFTQIIEAATAEELHVTKVLTTHKHHDHAGGNNKIASMIDGIEIVGGETEHVQGCTRTVRDGDTISVGSISVRCLHTPG